ncbi:MAG: iron ABC transporter permease [Desulfobacteraceae bacterium]|nr:iron ABC transporter permease [Desulfobacteraceae bacterium]
MNLDRNKYSVLLVVPPLAFLTLFYFYPLLKIFWVSLVAEGVFNTGRLERLFTTTYYAKTLWFTTWQAIVSTLLTLLLALPAAFVFARYRFPGKQLIQSLVTVPFVLPTVVVGSAFHALLGPRGAVNAVVSRIFNLDTPLIQVDHSIWFILLAHVFYNFTIVFRIVGSFWTHLEKSSAEAATMLGASPLQVFFKITLPLLRPAIFAASLLVFIFCFSSFGVILILGGPRYATIEVEIYRQAAHLFNLPMAAALSMVQIGFTLILMTVYTHLQRRTAITFNPVSSHIHQRRIKYLSDKLLVSGVLIMMFVLLGSPLLSLLWRSLVTADGLSLTYYLRLFENTSHSVFFVPPVKAILYSLGFGGITLVGALCLGLFAAGFLSARSKNGRSWLDPIFMLPLSTSAVTMGFGFILALDKPPLNLRASMMIIPLAHTLVAFPFVVRSILPALKSIPKSLKEAAALLGASPFQAWKAVELPIIRRATVVGAVFALTISLGEFGATSFVATPQTPTLPVAIYRFLGQPGALNYGQAMAMSSLLMMVTACGFLFLEKFRIGGMGEF